MARLSQRGHFLCVLCWNDLDKLPRRSCPECRAPVPKANRNKVAELAIRYLPRTCAHCGEEGTTLGHERECGRRPDAGRTPPPVVARNRGTALTPLLRSDQLRSGEGGLGGGLFGFGEARRAAQEADMRALRRRVGLPVDDDVDLFAVFPDEDERRAAAEAQRVAREADRREAEERLAAIQAATARREGEEAARAEARAARRAADEAAAARREEEEAARQAARREAEQRAEEARRRAAEQAAARAEMVAAQQLLQDALNEEREVEYPPGLLPFSERERVREASDAYVDAATRAGSATLAESAARAQERRQAEWDAEAEAVQAAPRGPPQASPASAVMALGGVSRTRALRALAMADHDDDEDVVDRALAEIRLNSGFQEGRDARGGEKRGGKKRRGGRRRA